VTSDLITELRVGWDLLLAGDPGPVREWLLDFGPWAPIASGVLHILAAVVPFLPGFVIAIANAAVFGAVLGGALTFLNGTLAAAACFGIARVAGRPFVERIVPTESLANVDRFMERRGVLAVFLARLVPIINPDVMSYAAGTTRIGWTRFLVAVAAGAVPATIFYSVIGAYAGGVTGWVFGVVVLAPVLAIGALWLLRHRVRWLKDWALGERGAGKPDDGAPRSG
jgi:uncharacterized membrane protein YdjX (TVP38/TMEM64 family)